MGQQPPRFGGMKSSNQNKVYRPSTTETLTLRMQRMKAKQSERLSISNTFARRKARMEERKSRLSSSPGSSPRNTPKEPQTPPMLSQLIGKRDSVEKLEKLERNVTSMV